VKKTDGHTPIRRGGPPLLLEGNFCGAGRLKRDGVFKNLGLPKKRKRMIFMPRFISWKVPSKKRGFRGVFFYGFAGIFVGTV